MKKKLYKACCPSYTFCQRQKHDSENNELRPCAIMSLCDWVTIHRVMFNQKVIYCHNLTELINQLQITVILV